MEKAEAWQLTVWFYLKKFRFWDFNSGVIKKSSLGEKSMFALAEDSSVSSKKFFWFEILKSCIRIQAHEPNYE